MIFLRFIRTIDFVRKKSSDRENTIVFPALKGLFQGITMSFNTMAAPRLAADSTPNWSNLVERIREKDSLAVEELYRALNRGLRMTLRRQLDAQDVEDRLHDVFLAVIGAIQNGSLRQPEALVGFAATVARRQIFAHIQTAIEARKRHLSPGAGLLCTIEVADDCNPEAEVLDRQNRELALKALQLLQPRQQEILKRFYLLEQSQEQICADMRLTETQFRLLKSRAKEKFGGIGRKTLNARRTTATSLLARTAA
ncbi:MAG: RNA polymerase sigma factor [Bryobacteraceae bacterium]